LKIKEKINSDKLSKFIANCMDDKKAEDIRIINLKEINNSVTDYFVLATGNSNIHIDAIADGIQENVFKEYNERPWKKEGIENREWILIDFVNVVAHIFDEKKRNLYELEKLWGDGIINNYNSKK
tara:strand:+ start:3410 stop:3784 length:375 start_codon:yes stop_codon:yes gene_type:complete